MYRVTHRPWCSDPWLGRDDEFWEGEEWEILRCLSCDATVRVRRVSRFPHWPGCPYAVVDEAVELSERGRVARRVRVCRGCYVEVVSER